MRRTIALALAAALAGCGGGFGNSKDHPLGTLAKLESRLVGSMELVKRPAAADVAAQEEWKGSTSVIEYHDTKAEENVVDFSFCIVLGLDAGGKVVRIHAVNFAPHQSGAIGAPNGSNKIRQFVLDLWEALGGGTNLNFNLAGRGFSQYDLAQFDSGAVTAAWIRPNGDPTETITFSVK